MITRKAYGGRYEITRNDKHVYQVIDGTEITNPLNVTSILDVISKPALLPWAAGEASRYWYEHVSAGETYDEVELKDILEDAKWAFRKTSRRAMNIGTLVHDFIESWLADSKTPLPEHDQAKRGCEKFIEWAHRINLMPYHTEYICFSEQFNYAGTMDFFGAINGNLAIADWKTSSGIYEEMGYQLSAYRWAIMEESLKEHRIYHKPESWIVRIDKENGQIEVKKLEDQDEDFEAFKGALAIAKRRKMK